MLRVLRAAPWRGVPSEGVVRALDHKGLALGEASFDFGGANETQAKFEMPVELRNEIARLEIARGTFGGGGFPSRRALAPPPRRPCQRRNGGCRATVARAGLLSRKALAPFADIRQASRVRRPIRCDLCSTIMSAIMILADVGMVPGEAHDDLAQFVEDGGILVRFAGTHLAGASDDLVPVRLRRGGRVLGGAMSWDTPKRLAPFDRESPFFGLPVPDEVTVSRQVLAEPDPGLSAKTWARLSDGTPLVTATRHGKGMIILFHVTADTTWSNLPLSGLFVDMLRKIIAMSGETAKDTDTTSRRRSESASNRPSRPTGHSTVLAFSVRRRPTRPPFPPGSKARPCPNIRRGFMVRPMRLSRSIAWDRRKPSKPADYSGLASSMKL